MCCEERVSDHGRGGGVVARQAGHGAQVEAAGRQGTALDALAGVPHRALRACRGGEVAA
nr:MAG TPA: hypothetical protein [Caudoviricetes sp.]